MHVMVVWKLKRKGSCSSSIGKCDEDWQVDYRHGIWDLSSAPPMAGGSFTLEVNDDVCPNMCIVR